MEDTDTESENLDFGGGCEDWFEKEEPAEVPATDLGDGCSDWFEKEEPDDVPAIDLGDGCSDWFDKEEPDDVPAIDFKDGCSDWFFKDTPSELPTTDFGAGCSDWFDQEEPADLQEVAVSPIEIKEDVLAIDYNAFVYTTRLDEMGVFDRDLRYATKEEVTNYIILESKPTLPKASHNRFHTTYVNLKTFKDIEQKLNEIYHKTQDAYLCKDYSSNAKAIKYCRSGDTNEKLLKLCKPVSVVLQDISIALPYIKQTHSRPRSDDDDIKRLKNKSGQLIVRGKTHHFVFKDYYSGETNIYSIDDSGRLTDHYKFHVVLDTHDFLSRNNCNIITLSNCCWHKRQQRIKNQIAPSFSKVTAEIMKTTHKCPPQCVCCCRDTKSKNIDILRRYLQSEPVIDEEVNEIEELDRQISKALCRLKNKISHSTLSEELDTKSKQSFTLIDEALKYKSIQKHPSARAATKKSEKIEKKVTMKNVEQCQSEFYEFRPDGSAMTYIKSNTDIKSKSSESSGFICCWFDRERVIKKMDLKLKSKQFLKTAHSCPPENCVCCCKPRQECIGRTFPSPKILKRVKHMPSFSSIDFNGGKFTTAKKLKKMVPNYLLYNCTRKATKRKPQKKIQKEKPNSNITSEPLNIMPKAIPTKPLSVSKNNSQTKMFENVHDLDTGDISANTDVTDEEPTLVESTNAHCVIVNEMHIPVQTSLQNTNAPITAEESVTGTETKNTSETFDVNFLISTILDRFKDVRLTINEDGKVEAEMKTPMDTLSTAELKVLGCILAHAQNQVKSLNLAPGADLTKHIQMLNDPLNNVATDTLIYNRTDTNTNTVTEENASTISGYLDATKLSLQIQVTESITSKFGNTIYSIATSSSTNTVSGSSLTTKDKISLYRHLSSMNRLKKQFNTNTFDSYFKNVLTKKANECPLQMPYMQRHTANAHISTPRIENVYSLQNVSLEDNFINKDNLKTAESKRKSAENSCPVQSKIRVLNPKDDKKTQTTTALQKTPSFIRILPRPDTLPPQIKILPQANVVQKLQDATINYNNSIDPNIPGMIPKTNTPPPLNKILLPLVSGEHSLKDNTINYNKTIAPNIRPQQCGISLIDSRLQTNHNISQVAQGLEIAPIISVALGASNSGQTAPQINVSDIIQLLPNPNLFPNLISGHSGKDVVMTNTVPEPLIPISKDHELRPIPNEPIPQDNKNLLGKELLETIGGCLDVVNTNEFDISKSGAIVVHNDSIEIDDNDDDKCLIKIDEEEDCILGI